MNSRTLNDMFSFRFLVVTLPLAALVSMTGCDWLATVSEERLVRQLDRHMREAYESYVEQPFFQATNTFIRYIGFLERNGEELKLRRDIDLLLYVAHAKLGYMLLHAGCQEGAYAELSSAYEHYKRVQLREGTRPVQRTEFVDFVTNAIEKVDAKTGAAWKSQFVLNPELVELVKSRFASNAIAPLPTKGD